MVGSSKFRDVFSPGLSLAPTNQINELSLLPFQFVILINILSLEGNASEMLAPTLKGFCFHVLQFE